MPIKPNKQATLEQSMDCFREALTEQGIVPFFALDNQLVTNLCNVIGGLHRMLESKGMTEQQIESELIRQLS